VVETSHGGLVIAGYTNSYGAGGSDCLITKLYADGTLNWAKTLGGSSDDVAQSVIETSDGGLVVAGYTNSYSTGSDYCLIAKLDADGTLNWARTLGNSLGLDDYAYSVIETSDGNLVVAGTETYNPQLFDKNVLIAKLEAPPGTIVSGCNCNDPPPVGIS